MNDMLAEQLALGAPLGNVVSALLTGPLLVFIWSRRGSRQDAALRAQPWQKTGWLVLLLAQITMAALGWVTGLDGLQWGPFAMIGAAALNYQVGRLLIAEATAAAQTTAAAPAPTSTEVRPKVARPVVSAAVRVPSPLDMIATPIAVVVEPRQLAEVLLIADRAVSALNHYNPREASRLRDEVRAAQFATEGIL